MNKINYILNICKLYIITIMLSTIIMILSIIFLEDDLWKSIIIGSAITIITTCIIEARSKYERNTERLKEIELDLIKLQTDILTNLTKICDEKGNMVDGEVDHINNLCESLRRLSTYLLFDINSSTLFYKHWISKLEIFNTYVSFLISDLESIKINYNNKRIMKLNFEEYLKNMEVYGSLYSVNEKAFSDFYISINCSRLVNMKTGLIISMMQELIVDMQSLLYKGDIKKCYKTIDMIMKDSNIPIYNDALNKLIHTQQ